MGTNGTNGTLFFITGGISQLGCGKKRKVPAKFKKCYFFTHFPILELRRCDAHRRAGLDDALACFPHPYANRSRSQRKFFISIRSFVSWSRRAMNSLRPSDDSAPMVHLTRKVEAFFHTAAPSPSPSLGAPRGEFSAQHATLGGLGGCRFAGGSRRFRYRIGGSFFGVRGLLCPTS